MSRKKTTRNSLPATTLLVLQDLFHGKILSRSPSWMILAFLTAQNSSLNPSLLTVRAHCWGGSLRYQRCILVWRLGADIRTETRPKLGEIGLKETWRDYHSYPHEVVCDVVECQWNVILFDSLEMRVGLVGIFRMQPNATRFIQTCLKYKSSHLNVCGVLDDLRLSHFAIPSTRLQKSFVCELPGVQNVKDGDHWTCILVPVILRNFATIVHLWHPPFQSSVPWTRSCISWTGP